MAIYLFVQYETSDGDRADLEEIVNAPPNVLEEAKEWFKKERLKEISEFTDLGNFVEMTERLEHEEREYQQVVFLEVTGIKELDYNSLKSEMLDELHRKVAEQKQSKKEDLEWLRYQELKNKFEKGT